MKFDHAKEFVAGLQAQEEIHAHEINDHYDKLVDSGFAGVVLDAAIENANVSLADTVPGGETFGYETASRAWNWWGYRNAKLRDLAPNYDELDAEAIGDPWEAESGSTFMQHNDKMQARKIEQGRLGDLMSEQNPFVFKLFDHMEKIRKRFELRGTEIGGDIFESELRTSLRMLLNVLDETLARESGYGDDNERYYHGSIDDLDEESDRPLEFSIYWQKRTMDNNYALDIFDPVGQADYEQAPEGEEPIISYEIRENQAGINIYAKQPDVYTPEQPKHHNPKILEVIGMAKDFASTSSFSPQRERFKNQI